MFKKILIANCGAKQRLAAAGPVLPTRAARGDCAAR
jgi:hypothetical protein